MQNRRRRQALDGLADLRGRLLRAPPLRDQLAGVAVGFELPGHGRDSELRTGPEKDLGARAVRQDKAARGGQGD